MSQVESQGQSDATGLWHYLSPLNIWGYSLGCAIGWGAFVMPSTTLLPDSGPLGTVVGMLIAALIMVVVAWTFHYMCNQYPDSGGAYTFVKRTMGFDHAFLCAWALILAYIAILWANATAFILIIRFLLGPVFQFGFHYVVAGYDVYFGEIIVTLIILVAFGMLAAGKRKILKSVNTVLALILALGVLACFLIVFGASGFNQASFEPGFSPDVSPGVGVFGIVALAPWAFLGFESVSHAAGECAFPQKKMFGIMAAAVICGALIYIFMTLVSVMGMPAGYDSWVAYMADLSNQSGISGLPTFHAMQLAMGTAGVIFLAVVVVAAVSTSLIGLYRASSRIIYSVAQDEVLPPWFGKLNKDGVPRNAMFAIMVVSIIVPFVGRAAIGWIVDVTSVSAAIVYGYVALCSYRLAKPRGDRGTMVLGAISFVASAVFLVYPLIPNIWSVSALAPESYLILVGWSMVGLLLFRVVFMRDKHNRFGKSTIMWILMIFLILFASTMWMRQVSYGSMEDAVADINDVYVEEYADHGVELGQKEQSEDLARAEERVSEVRSVLLENSMMQMVIILFSLVIMFNIYSLMRKREQQHDAMRANAEESSKAKTTFLSNMSHDIRTPMNAILGYTHLARREDTTPEEAREYLEKIDSSSKHLLALINDILEMSRIESGKMELEPVESDLCKLMDEVRDMFATQMQTKGIAYTVDVGDVKNSRVMCDANRLNRVLLNLISNAYKFTPENGSVMVSLTQLGDAQDGRASYELRVKDTGIGMTEEFAEKVFEAFERERNTTVSGIQGTGLGMAITKSIVDAMGGTIEVITAEGEGTEFVVHVAFDVLEEAADAQAADTAEHAEGEVDFTGKRILLVEDNEINREIASFILEDAGFVIDIAENGKEALDKVVASEPGDYDIILMDVQMPIMNGYEATQAIRALDNPELASIPIVAASANAFSEDVQNARNAGMDAHIAKPLDVPKVMDVLSKLL